MKTKYYKAVLRWRIRGLAHRVRGARSSRSPVCERDESKMRLLVTLLSICVLGASNHALAQTTTLDIAGDWAGTTEFSVSFDYYPSRVTCQYAGTMVVTFTQDENTVSGSASGEITHSTTPTGCYSWHESWGYGAIEGELFGSAFSGTLGSSDLTGSVTGDTFVGQFSKPEDSGDVSVNGEFTLLRQGTSPTPPGTGGVPNAINQLLLLED